MKVVSMNSDSSYLVEVFNRSEFQKYCKDMVNSSLSDVSIASTYGFGRNDINFGAKVDFTQYCNFKKIPIKELPKVVNSIKTIIRSEIQEYIKENNINLGKYTNISVSLVNGIQCGMAVKKFNGDELVRDYQNQWEEVNAELYCGKHYSEKQFAALKERKNQIYRKRQIMWMEVRISLAKQ